MSKAQCPQRIVESPLYESIRNNLWLREKGYDPKWNRARFSLSLLFVRSSATMCTAWKIRLPPPNEVRSRIDSRTLSRQGKCGSMDQLSIN